jgi:hypothetical protein
LPLLHKQLGRKLGLRNILAGVTNGVREKHCGQSVFVAARVTYIDL